MTAATGAGEMLVGYENTPDAVRDPMVEDEHTFMSLEHYYTALRGSAPVPPRSSDVPPEAIEDAQAGGEFGCGSLSCGVFFLERDNDKSNNASGTHDLACGLDCVFGEDLAEIVECKSLREAFDLRKNMRDIFFRPGVDGAARLAPFDGVRALAFIWVVSDHAQEVALEYVSNQDSSNCVMLEASDTAQSFTSWTCALASGGGFGVTIFFVLSGFLIVYILVSMVERENELSYCRFITRRFFRLWPSLNAYWILSLPIFLYLVPENTENDVYKKWVEPCTAGCWTNLVFITDFGTCLPWDGGQEHLWTVSTEFQMYLITPLFVWAFLYSEVRRRPRIIA